MGLEARQISTRMHCDQQPCEKSALSSSVMHVSIKFTFPLQMTVSCCISPLLCALLFKPVISFLFHYKSRRPPTWNFSVLLVYKPMCTWDSSFSSYYYVLILSKINPSTGALIIFFSVLFKKIPLIRSSFSRYFVNIQT